MSCPRFTIRSLLGVVLFVAIAVAALRASTDAWDSGVLGLTWLIMLVSILLAIHRTERKRAFWLGFALFGWAYLVTSLTPIESRLPTTKSLAYLDSKVPGRKTIYDDVVMLTLNDLSSKPHKVHAVRFSPQGNNPTTSPLTAVRLLDATTSALVAGPNGTTEYFVRIGHSLLALIMAFGGGCLSRLLDESGRRRTGDIPESGDTRSTA